MTCENKSSSHEAIPNVDARPRGLKTPKVGPGEFHMVLMQRLNKTPQGYGLMRGNRANSSRNASLPKSIAKPSS